jgi:tetratricopeptide (TPR) repeat protein
MEAQAARKNAPRQPSFLLGCLVLAVLVLAIYWQTGVFDFVNYDDSDYVSANRIVQRGLSAEGIGYAFTSVVAGNWQPITLLSHMLDCQFWGTRPGPHHLTNLALHLANTLLVFWFLRSLTRAFWPSMFVAALFAAHPLHVESVAWIAERKDVLSTFFWLTTICAYLRYVSRMTSDQSGIRKPELERNPKTKTRTQTQASGTRPSRGTLPAPRRTASASLFYSLSLLLFALGLMAKPMLVTVPFTLLLLDYWPLRRIPPAPRWATEVSRKLLLEKVPFFAGSLVISVIALFAQRKMGALVSHFPLSMRIGNALISCIRYLGKVFWPAGLAIPYPYPSQIPVWQVLIAGVLLALITGLVVWQLRPRPYLAVGWFWYLGTLVPVIGLVQVGMQAMADRYTYVPSLGIFVMLAWGGRDILRWGIERTPIVRYAAYGLGAASVLVFAALSFMQTRVWKNTETLFTHTVRTTGDNMFAQYNLGNWYYTHDQFEQAVEQYRGALRAHPGYADAENNLGNALGKLGRNEEAAEHYAAALKSGGGAASRANQASSLLKAGKADDAIAMYQQAVTLQPSLMEAHNGLGAAFAQKGNLEAAINEFQQAVELRPEYVSARINLASTLARAGRASAAIEQYEAAARLDPGNFDAHEGAADLLAERGATEQAIAHYRRAKEIAPNNYLTRNGLGVSLGSQGKMQEAAAEFEAAIRLNPTNAFARVNLGNTIAATGRIPEAIACYQAALKLDPNDPQAHHNLGTALADQGKLAEAESHYRAAAKIDEKNHETCYNLAILLERMNRRADAIAQLQETLRRKPDYAPASNELMRLTEQPPP